MSMLPSAVDVCYFDFVIAVDASLLIISIFADDLFREYRDMASHHASFVTPPRNIRFVNAFSKKYNMFQMLKV